ncbi:hypothetical protein ACC817_22600 [Rhizobium ruizarguesonis]|uniref:hypothetical protein n=1 Tax=Rhizobium leguminosarum TaxID=384 RepID=UPI003F973D64
MTKNWRDDLRLKLEDFVDTFVVNGAKQVDVYNAIQKELDSLRAAYDRDPDPLTIPATWSTNLRTTGPLLKTDHAFGSGWFLVRNAVWLKCF